MKKIMVIFGTRPEGIKMAPLIRACKQKASWECVVVNTGQHLDMLDQVLHLFAVRPDYDLHVMETAQSTESIIATILQQLSDILDKEKPDLVLVHGDTTTTFSGALAAFLKKIPIGHVEAGLRTNQRYSPFPEEMNRQMVSRLATLHFAPTEKNKETLVAENVDPSTISVVGNTVIDALLDVTSRPFLLPEKLQAFLSNGNQTILMTTHRRENLQELKYIYEAVNQIVDAYPSVQFLFPIHKNPAVRKEVAAFLRDSKRIRVVEPMDYETFSHTMKQVHFVLTDSGGIQEEAPALGKPVLVARSSTERQEGIDSGSLRLVGTSTDSIVAAVKELMEDDAMYSRMSQAQNPYGTGDTATQIIQLMDTYLQRKPF